MFHIGTARAIGEDDFVILSSAYLFLRDDLSNTRGQSTAHLYGTVISSMTFQVCSPIREINLQEDLGYVEFVTRSYNKYTVPLCFFEGIDENTTEILTKKLRYWLGSDKITKVYEVPEELQEVPLYKDPPTEFEKTVYGV